MAEGQGSAMLPEAGFHFYADGVSESWQVVHLHARSALSELSECVLELAHAVPPGGAPVHPEDMVGQRAQVEIERGEHDRHFVVGIIAAAEDVGATAGHQIARVRIVPDLWRLSQRSHFRIFQDLDALEILKDVLKDAGIYQGAGFDEKHTHGKASKREYSVQLGETDLDYVARLLAEEGLSWFFVDSDGHHKLVVADSALNDAFAPVQTFRAHPLHTLAHDNDTSSFESIRSIEFAREAGLHQLTLADYDFTRPAARIKDRKSPGQGTHTRYEYPGPITLSGYNASSHAWQKDNAVTATSARSDALTSHQRLVRGQSNVQGFSAGCKFTITGAEHPTFKGPFVLTQVTHVGHAPEVLEGDRASQTNAGDRYQNTFEGAPKSVRVRPVLPFPRPRATFPQTATVMAEAGSSDEICTDHYGRVLVRFHWDADGGRVASQQSKRSSCWIRTAQALAGAMWGFLFVPRVGMEVIVQFLDGDPDRPIITGCVYNGAHSTPVKLPEKKTQSVIRTQSSPGGAGYNELRFEDAAGDEHVWFRAQKDHTAHVLHDHKESVDHDQTTVVKHDSFLEVGNDRAVVVKGNQKHAVTKNQGVAVKGNALREVTGNESLVVHKSRTTHVDQEWKLTADEGASVAVGGSAKLDMKPDEILMEAPSGITFKCGDNKIAMTPTGITLQTSAGAKVVLQGPMVNVEGGANVTVKAGAMLTIQGVLVKIN